MSITVPSTLLVNVMNMMLDSFCYLLFIVIAMKAYSHRLVADIFVDHSPFILLPIDAIGGPANLFHVLKANTTESSFKFNYCYLQASPRPHSLFLFPPSFLTLWSSLLAKVSRIKLQRCCCSQGKPFYIKKHKKHLFNERNRTTISEHPFEHLLDSFALS